MKILHFAGIGRQSSKPTYKATKWKCEKTRSWTRYCNGFTARLDGRCAENTNSQYLATDRKHYVTDIDI